MLGKFKNLLIVCGVSTLTVISLLGSVTSTLSWFNYANRSVFVFHGTTISTNKFLQVGLLTDVDLSEQGLTTEEVERTINVETDVEGVFEEQTIVEKIAWAYPGQGLTNTQIYEYLAKMDYAAQYLIPVTTRRYTTNQTEELKLYSSPYDYKPNNLDEAKVGEYSRIPICFRVLSDSSNSETEYFSDIPVWVTQVSVDGDENLGVNVGDSVRLYFKSDSGNFILNPSAEEGGYTAVAGLLDLNNDGYYDTAGEDKTELIFGDYYGEPEYHFTEEATEIDDVNQTGKDEEYIFCAKHASGSHYISSYEGLDIGYAQYESVSSVAPTLDETKGLYTGGMPVCVTDEHYVGYTTMLVWTEGWDLANVNSIFSLQFNLGLRFEINKV